jgi:SAM-dependent methyltransferase
MDSAEDVRAHNRVAWDRKVAAGNEWTRPVSTAETAAAGRGEWSILLTPVKAVPREWFGAAWPHCDVLCLAGSGGQQGPILAAAGARVTVLDNSPAQLAQDKLVARRDGLTLRTVEGDAADLSAFGDMTFDLIVHPVSNCFMPDVLPVWRECFRVLRHGGTLLSGMCNPATFLLDLEAEARGEIVVRHSLPYADLTHLTKEDRGRILPGEPLEYSHTLNAQIGGQLVAGFLLAGFYEDNWRNAEGHPLAAHMPCFFATRAVKPLPPSSGSNRMSDPRR